LIAATEQTRHNPGAVSEDIRQPELGELDWSGDGRAGALAAVYRHAIGYAEQSEEWYFSHRASKQLGGQALRVGAIALGAIAAILPVISELSDNAVAAGWATVALALAAAFLALDRFFGFSSGWMRFMVTGQEVASLRHEFEYEWQSKAASAAEAPSDDQTLALLKLASGLVAAVDATIARETGAWVTEFDSALRRIEKELSRQDI
jgi:SMODS and SLOG-associating 2TM effector domain 2